MGGPIVFVNMEMKNCRCPPYEVQRVRHFPGQDKGLDEKSRGFWKYIRTQFIWESAAAETGKVRLCKEVEMITAIFKKAGIPVVRGTHSVFKKIPYFPAVETRSGRQENGI